MTARETSRRYDRPRRSVLVPWINAAFRALGRWSQPRIDAAAWFRAVDAPPGWDSEPFEVLARSLTDEARLTPIGRVLASARVLGALRSRANVEALGPPPDGGLAPIVIVGPHRSGTTLLHRLLDKVPGLRTVQTWEALNPAPWPGERSPDGRQRHATRAGSLIRHIAPDYLAVHPMDPWQPEEEVILFEHVGLSTSYEAMFRVPTYAAWLEDRDQAPAYAWLGAVLRHLDPGAQWVLKSPHHLEFLDALLDAFPGARLVWTRRDPRSTLPSLCSMVAHGVAMSSDEVDRLEIGRHWLRKTTRMLERAADFRRRRPDVPVLDVEYDELTADPEAVVRSIVRFGGGELDEVGAEAVRAGLVANPVHRFGRHVYAASDFGLDGATLDQLASHLGSRSV